MHENEYSFLWFLFMGMLFEFEFDTCSTLSSLNVYVRKLFLFSFDTGVKLIAIYGNIYYNMTIWAILKCYDSNSIYIYMLVTYILVIYILVTMKY